MPDAIHPPYLHVVPSSDGGSARKSVTQMPYPLEVGFEAALVAALVQRPALWRRIGAELDPAFMPTASAGLLLKAAADVARERPSAAPDTLPVLQRIRLWSDEGKLAVEKLDAAKSLLDGALEHGLPDDDALCGGVVPILRQRLEQAAVIAGTMEFAKGKGGDMGRVSALIERARHIGEVDDGFGNMLRPASFDAIRAISLVRRFATGIQEVDVAANGGLVHGGLGIIAGSTGVGKSLTIDQIIAEGLRGGMFCGLVTLELSREEHEARIMANLSGCTIDSILSGEGPEYERARATMEGLFPRMGWLTTIYMESASASVVKIKEWVRRESERAGTRMNLLCIDFLKKVKKVGTEKLRDDEGGERTEMVFDAMRNFAYKDGEVDFIWTPDHVRNRNARKNRKLDVDDVAGSSEKTRTADLVLGLEHAEDDQLQWTILKNRHGPFPLVVGSLPHNKACGRIGPVQRS